MISEFIQQSCIYQGQVYHQRHVQKKHKFTYRLFMIYLDLDVVEQVSKRFWFLGYNKRRPISFWRKDYLPQSPSLSLKSAVCALVKNRTGTDITGKIFILTHPRWFGLVVNPLTLYYCFNESGSLTHVVGEITNTPWNERHSYVMNIDPATNAAQTFQSFSFPKEFHVSPFLPMAMDYTWQVSLPLKQLAVNIWNRVDGRLDFEAHLVLEKYPLSAARLFSCWLQDPWITLKILFGIYWNAAILYFGKRVMFYSHPNSSSH